MIMVHMLAIYKFRNKLWFRDERLGQYREVFNPSSFVPIDDVPNSKLQRPTPADSRKVFGRGILVE